MTAPGWYNAQGDPPGTTRYWDGTQWVGDPVPTPAANPMGSAAGGVYVDGAPGNAGLNLASAGLRIGARLLDGLIVIVVALILMIPLIIRVIDDIDALGPNPTDSQVEDVFRNVFEDNIGWFVVLGAIALLWDFLWVALFGGTPGKLITGIRVAHADTGVKPPGWGKAALRALNRLVGLVPGFGGFIGGLIGLVSLIMLFADDKHRTVMDRIAGTVVVKK